jgi:hypothetical protein
LPRLAQYRSGTIPDVLEPPAIATEEMWAAMYLKSFDSALILMDSANHDLK